MQLSDFLDFDAIKPALSGGNKRSLLQQLANLAGQRLGLDASLIHASLIEREQLGSTGFGQGVAIPHGKIEGLNRIYGLFVRLAEPVDFKAIDARPVDLIFLQPGLLQQLRERARQPPVGTARRITDIGNAHGYRDNHTVVRLPALSDVHVCASRFFIARVSIAVPAASELKARSRNCPR